MDWFLYDNDLRHERLYHCILILFRMRKGKKPLPLPRISFSPVTSTNLGISSRNMNFSFYPFATVGKNFKAIHNV